MENMDSQENGKTPYCIQGRVWINKNGTCFLELGYVELLHAILTEGSINAAARKIGVSYQHAWKTIEQMNRLSPLPIVVLKRGGKDGGGAELTTYGLKVINEMNQLEMALADFLLNANKHFDVCFDSCYTQIK